MAKRNNSKKNKRNYKHESALLNARKGRKEAIAELENENTVYMLAQEPVYIHSREHYYKKGHETAIKILNRELSSVVTKVHAEANRLIPLLDAEVQNIVQSFGMSNWEEFRQWWAKEVQPSSVDLQTNKDALYYLALLEKIKKQATSIGTYLYIRNKGRAGKGQGMTESGVKQLINAGFVNVGFKGQYGESAGANATITKIRAEQRKDIVELSKWIVPHLVKINDKTADAIINKLKSVTGPNLDGLSGTMDIDQTFATQIGTIEEYISNMFYRELENGIIVEMDNVAAEKNKGQKDKTSKKFKADTQITMSLGSLQLSFLASDKTGMETVFEKNTGKATGYQDKFTAGIATDTLRITDVETIANLDNIDPRLNDVFLYIIKNADFFNLQDKEGKTLIVAFFAWVKLITEIVGVQRSIKDMPVVIRMFNRLYKTSDILRTFTNKRGVEIMEYVNKSYLYNFYEVYKKQNAVVLSRQELRNIKKEAMQKMSSRVTYKKLKNSIMDTLKDLNGVVTRDLKFSTSFRILLDNVENLKEFV